MPLAKTLAEMEIPEEPPAVRGGLNLKWLITGIAVFMALFHLYTGGLRTLPALQQRSMHLGLGLLLIYLINPWKKGNRRTSLSLGVDVTLGFMSLAVCFYLFFNYRQLTLRIGNPNTIDILCGIATTLLLLEATRRIMGWAMPIIALVSIAYSLLGSNLPGFLGHRGYELDRLITQIYLGTEGIFGLILGVSATFVILFVILASLLEMAGGGKVFLDLAFSLFGTVRGGPAKVAVVGSGLFGMISGAPAANVVGTGTFTIPLMKKIGFTPEFAGAVECVASTGGQLMPPIMGAAAFIMAEILGISYWSVAVASIIPAILYYFTCFLVVDLEAGKLGFRGLPRGQLPNFKNVLLKGGHLLIPLVVLIYFLGIALVSPLKAAFWACISCIISSWIRSSTRLGPMKIAEGFEKGVRGALLVMSVCAVAGIVIGCVGLTGLGLKLSEWMVNVASGSTFLLLVLSMIASLILGMGLPTAACYIILAILAAPGLVKGGISPLGAHLFVFYFGMMSNFTPPVAPASYVAAGLAGSDPMKTALTALRLGLAGFILPYLFVYNKGMLLDSSIGGIVFGVLVGLLGLTALSIAFAGYLVRECTFFERVVFFISGVLIIHPEVISTIVASIVLFAFGIKHILHAKRFATLNPG